MTLSTHDDIDIVAHHLSINLERGADDFVINGKSMQTRLNDVSSYLDEKKLDVTLAEHLSS